MIPLEFSQQGWEEQFGKRLEAAGYPNPQQAVDQARAHRRTAEAQSALRGKFASAAPETILPPAAKDVDSQSEYVGCSVGSTANAIVDVFDPTTVTISWTGLKLTPPFVYAGLPYFFSCNSVSCSYFTASWGGGTFSHTVHATVDTFVQIPQDWCS